MSFLDFFRPRWRHSDPAIRALAVRDLSDDDSNLLATLALQDPELDVRRLAVKKLRDPHVLAEVATKERDLTLKALAGEKAQDLYLQAAIATGEEIEPGVALAHVQGAPRLTLVANRAVLAVVRRGALDRLTDQKAISHVVLGSQDAQLRLLALGKLTDDVVLAQIARDCGDKEIALPAASRVTDPRLQRELATGAKLKAVRTLLEQRLAEAGTPLRPDRTEQAPAPALAKRLRQRLTQICVAIEPLCRSSSNWAECEQKIAEAESRWSEIGPLPGDEAIKQRFAAAKATFLARKAVADADSQRQADALRTTEQKRQRLAMAAMSELPVKRAPEPAALPPPPRQVAESAAPLAPAEPDPAAVELARELAAQREVARAALLDELTRAAAALAPLVTSEDSRDLADALREARPLAKRAEIFRQPEVVTARERLEAVVAALSARLDGLREAEEWRRWTNLPKFEQLIKEAEALAEVVETVEEKRGVPVLVKELQARWKAVGPLPSKQSQPLWERFKKACDTAFAKCGEYFAQQDAARPENLTRKEELCARAEALQDSSDWKETSELMRLLQEEWKTIGPVPDEQREAVWKRFRTACDHFYERRTLHDKERDGDRVANLKRKEELCAEAEAASHSSDWRETSDQLKRLQEEWKSVGPVPKEAGDEVWKRFRTTCDRFFEARQAAFAAQDAERQDNLIAKTKLCEEAEALANLEDGEQAREAAKDLQHRWRAIGHVPREVSDELWGRFRHACDKVFEEPPDEGEAPHPEAVVGEGIGIGGFVNKLALGHLVNAAPPETERAAAGGDDDLPRHRS